MRLFDRLCFRLNCHILSLLQNYSLKKQLICTYEGVHNIKFSTSYYSSHQCEFRVSVLGPVQYAWQCALQFTTNHDCFLNPVAINSPHSWRRRINTMVTDTAFPMEPSKQCKRRTNVHYQSEILHKIPHSRSARLFRLAQLFRQGTHRAISLCKLFLRSFIPNEDNYQEQQQVICTDSMFETNVCFALGSRERKEERKEMKAKGETWCFIVTS